MILPVGTDVPYFRKPVVTYSIILLCFVIEVVRIWVAVATEYDMILHWGYIPGYGSLLTVFTSMFLHADPFHLIGNMIFFYIVACKMEDFLGPVKFLLFYLGAGIAANAVHVVMSGVLPIPCIGASGAIAGVLGGFMVLYPVSKVKMAYIFNIWLRGIFWLPAWLYLGFWFAKEVASAFLMGNESGVAFGAHIGGFAAGMVWMWCFFGWRYGNYELDIEMRGYRAPKQVSI